MSATITPIGGGAVPPAQPKPARRKRRKQRLAANRRSGGSPYDDLALVLERALYLQNKLCAEIASEDGVILAHLVRMELEDLEAIITPAPEDWYEEG